MSVKLNKQLVSVLLPLLPMSPGRAHVTGFCIIILYSVPLKPKMDFGISIEIGLN